MSRACPFHGCGKVIDPSLFACARHWSSMRDDDRKKIWQVWNAYRQDRITLEDLVAEQKAVMAHYGPKDMPELSEKGAATMMVAMAQAVLAFVRLRKEYTACPDGFLEKKKKLGVALGRAEKALADLAHGALHPPQEQLRLFDPGEKPAGPPH